MSTQPHSPEKFHPISELSSGFRDLEFLNQRISLLRPEREPAKEKIRDRLGSRNLPAIEKEDASTPTPAFTDSSKPDHVITTSSLISTKQLPTAAEKLNKMSWRWKKFFLGPISKLKDMDAVVDSDIHKLSTHSLPGNSRENELTDQSTPIVANPVKTTIGFKPAQVVETKADSSKDKESGKGHARSRSWTTAFQEAISAKSSNLVPHQNNPLQKIGTQNTTSNPFPASKDSVAARSPLLSPTQGYPEPPPLNNPPKSPLPNLAPLNIAPPKLSVGFVNPPVNNLVLSNSIPIPAPAPVLSSPLTSESFQPAPGLTVESGSSPYQRHTLPRVSDSSSSSATSPSHVTASKPIRLPRRSSSATVVLKKSNSLSRRGSTKTSLKRPSIFPQSSSSSLFSSSSSNLPSLSTSFSSPSSSFTPTTPASHFLSQFMNSNPPVGSPSPLSASSSQPPWGTPSCPTSSLPSAVDIQSSRTQPKSGVSTMGSSPAASFLASFADSRSPQDDTWCSVWEGGFIVEEGDEVGEYVVGKQIGTGTFSSVHEAFLHNSETNATEIFALKVVLDKDKIPSPTPTHPVSLPGSWDSGQKRSRTNTLPSYFGPQTAPAIPYPDPMESIGKSAEEGKDDKSDFFSPLEHEIDLWKNIRHPHLLELKDVITTPEAMFIFSEYVPDGNLLTLVNEWDRICFSTPSHGDKDVASDGILDIGAEWIKIARSISSQGQLDIDSTALEDINIEQIQGSTGDSLSPKPPISSQKKLLPSHIRHRQKSQQTVRLTRSQSVSLESLDAFKSRRSNGSPKASAPMFPSVNSSSSINSASSKSRHPRTTLGLPESFARSIFSQLSAAIKYLHNEVGILHRDLKLENVLCRFEWVIVSVYVDQNGNEIDPLEILNLLPPLSPISSSNLPPYNCNIDTTKLRKVLKRKLLKVHVKLCDFGLSDWIEPTKQKLVELVLNMRGEPLPTPTTSSFTTSNGDAQESELQMVRNNPMYTTHHYLGNLLPANDPTCSIPSKSTSNKACTGSKYVHEAMGSLEYCSPEELAPDCVLVERNSPYSLMSPSSIQDSMDLMSSADQTSVVTSPSPASIASLEKLVTRYLTSSEIWSLGVILYALLTGMMPFQAEFEPRLVKLIREGKYNPLQICEIDETDKEGLQWIKDIVGCVPEENLDELFSIIYEADCGMKGSKVNDELSLSLSSNGMKKLKSSQLETVMETTEEYRTTPSHSRNPSFTIGKSSGIGNGAANSLNEHSILPPTKRKVTKLPPPSLLHFRDHDGKVTEEAAKVLSGCFAIDWRTRWNCETIEKCEWFKI